MGSQPASRPRQTPGSLFAVAAVILWASNLIAARGIAEAVPPFTLSAIRWGTACLILFPFAGKDFLREWPRIRPHIRYYSLLSLLGMAVISAAVYLAAHSTEAVNMALINTTTPIFTLILARVFLHETLSAARCLGIVIVLAGVFLLLLKGDPRTLLDVRFHPGDLFMLISALSFAGYSILLRRQPVELSDNGFHVTTFGISFILLLPFAVLELFLGLRMTLSPASLGQIAYIVVAASVLCYWCWDKAVALIGPARASLIYYSIPLFSGLGGLVFLDEPISWVHFASCGLILSGIFVALRK